MEYKNIGSNNYGIIEGIEKVPFKDSEQSKNFINFENPVTHLELLKKRAHVSYKNNTITIDSTTKHLKLDTTKESTLLFDKMDSNGINPSIHNERPKQTKTLYPKAFSVTEGEPITNKILNGAQQFLMNKKHFFSGDTTLLNNSILHTPPPEKIVESQEIPAYMYEKHKTFNAIIKSHLFDVTSFPI